MTSAADFTKQLEKILAAEGTKSSKARALFDLGCTRSEVVELTGMTYGQAHTLWRERSGEHPQGRNRSGSGRAAKVASRPLPYYSRAGRKPDQAGSSPLSDGLAEAISAGGAHSERFGRPLRLSPAQTRYIEQDGHFIVRTDTTSGPICDACKEPVQFTLVYLGFVHTNSRALPTNMEDVYSD